ncbi:DUF4395 domain-containing protein [Neobacillus vireti]|uniref:DUF4395 domain-containing protein n=1 Tax=Neobacillus vireti TaxID=220686 RepID=UPI003000B36D
MSDNVRSIPRPLVRTNQWVIFISAVLALIFAEGWFLIVPLLAGISGIVFKYNPIMNIAKLFLKKKQKGYIPEDWEQQQFNQKIAVFCLSVGFISFLLGWKTAGYVFTIMVGTAAFVAILGFCIGCFIHYQWKMYQYKKANS